MGSKREEHILLYVINYLLGVAFENVKKIDSYFFVHYNRLWNLFIPLLVTKKDLKRGYLLFKCFSSISKFKNKNVYLSVLQLYLIEVVNSKR